MDVHLRAYRVLRILGIADHCLSSVRLFLVKRIAGNVTVRNIKTR